MKSPAKSARGLGWRIYYIFILLIAANWCVPAAQRIGGVGGDAELAVYVPHKKYFHLFLKKY